MDNNSNTDARAPMSIRELVETLWSRRVFIFIVCVFCTAIAGVGGYLSRKDFKATTVLVVATRDATDLRGIGSMLSQIGPLASLAGLSGMQGDQKSETIAVLQSTVLTMKFIEEKNLLPILYPDQWDPNKKTWKSTNEKQRPTLWKASQKFKKLARVVEDRKTGLVTVTVRWKDPKVAAQWANGLVAETNRYMREKTIRESEHNIQYLSEQIAKSELVGVRSTLYGLVENEIKENMLARGRVDYALKVVDPAVPPEFPASPRLLVWLIGGLLIGVFVGCLAVMFSVAWIEGRRHSA
jgi:uncharacterized protein involved in exopolysaccharide biosynthesis